MNIKKIGLTALAGSLVATSVYAGSLSVSGGASFEVQHVGGGAANSGKAYSMGNSVTFTGAGELLAEGTPVPPCGACRQVIAESIQRQGTGFELLLVGKNRQVLKFKNALDLLPLPFGL